MADQPNDGSGLPPAPAIQPEPATPAGPAPTTVVRAVQLMFVSAALGALYTILFVANRDALRAQILEADPNAQNVDTAVNGAVAFSIITGVVFTALWIWLALMVRQGKNWARITTWVLAGLGLLFALFDLINMLNALTATLSIIAGLVDLAIIVLLAMRPSNEYFKPRRV